MKANELISVTQSKIRFSEVDSMAVVWHGNYLKFLEDGREDFGNKFGLGYYDVYDQGFMTPIVKIEINYVKQTKYGDILDIETKFVNSDAAKIIFDYVIKRKSDGAVVLKARSIQVFLNKNGDMEFTNPEFYLKWKKQNGII